MKKIIFLLFVSQFIYSQGFLKTNGTKIVDESGNEFLFKGIGLGGWLVPEGYMLNMSGFANSPTEIKNKIIDLVGETNTESFFDTYRANFVTREDIDSIATWGFNSIRLPMHYELMTPRDQPFVYIEKGFAYIDSLLAWCKPNNIYLILDLHAAPGGQSDEPISDYDSNFPSLWESDLNKLRTIDLWKHIAERYKNEPYIAGYDLLNEPKWNLPPNNQPLRDLYINITDAIRQVDSNHIVFVEGNWFATDMTGLTPPWDNNMAYSFHKYWSEVSQNSIQSYLTLRNNYNTPLWMSESGENSNSWFTDFISLLNQNSVGWHWWTLKKFESISVLASVPISPQFQVLLNYWNGQAAKPSVDFAVAALTLQANNLLINNCTIKDGVINAMMKLPYDNVSKPFVTNAIPGRIFAATYDYGNQNIAYNDGDYENTGNGAYNLGYSFRNDGVDIEPCTDQITNGFNVGWIATGEWLKFSVDVAENGNYDILFRIAANQSGGKIQLYLDNTVLTDLIDVPLTGGWKSWQSLQVSSISIPQGSHELVVRFFFGGFNLNYINFSLSPTDVKKKNMKPIKFGLEQNYPNPFNPTTKINFSIPKLAKINLTVYNSLGKVIRTLAKGNFVAGIYTVQFNAKNLASGIYFYRINAVNEAKNFVKIKKMMLLK